MSIIKTVDGNYAAAHVAYAFSEVAAIYQSPRPLLWQKTPMNLQRQAQRTCSDKNFVWPSFNPKEAPQAQFTGPLPQAL